MSLINQQITELIKEEKLQLEENRVEATGSGRMTRYKKKKGSGLSLQLI